MLVRSRSRCQWAAVSLLFVASICAAGPKLQTHRIDPGRELIITDLAVVDSPMASYPGPWSFGHLIRNLAGPGNEGAFLESWLGSWETDQMVNKQVIPARRELARQLLRQWQERDGFQPPPPVLGPGGAPVRSDAGPSKWDPNFFHAPFRLLAIVNRLDTGIRIVRKEVEENRGLPGLTKVEVKKTEMELSVGLTGTPQYYGSSEAQSVGEARFVFAAIDQAGEPIPGGFTVIFEYGLPGQDMASAVSWASLWHSLGDHKSFDDAYRRQLMAITGGFSKDGSTLRQIRTNDAAFGEVQELREFSYTGSVTTSGASGSATQARLSPSTVAGTPAPEFALGGETAYQLALSAYINDQEREILDVAHVVPGTVDVSGKTVGFLGARAVLAPVGEAGDREKNAGFFWDAPRIQEREARRIFSLNTCNGCHGAETAAAGGFHIFPRRAGEEARLSDFLRLDGRDLRVPDPPARARAQRPLCRNRASHPAHGGAPFPKVDPTSCATS
ncbi:MAG: hypothetical protein R3F11_18300 [Verrucomicrobiales bacterium]